MRVLLQSVVESFLGGEADPAEASVEARFFILRTHRDVTDVQARAHTHTQTHADADTYTDTLTHCHHLLLTSSSQAVLTH